MMTHPARREIHQSPHPMGLDAASAKMLLDARVLDDVDFSSTLTLGHQELNLFPNEADRFAAACAGRLQNPSEAATVLAWGAYADGFLRTFLGASDVRALDYSSFEGADIVHDMNVPVPASFDERFDAVIDGGTLEHVYNVPVAWQSCMRMLKVGGRLFLFTTANNFCGHGFYQFSPELFFRLFSADNGFRVEQMLLVDYRLRGGLSLSPTCYAMIDPAVAGARSMVYTRSRTLCFVRAQKMASTATAFSTPLQSDYVERWSGGDGTAHPRSGLQPALRRLHAALPPRVRQLTLEYYQRYYALTFRNRRFYRRVPFLDFSAY
jgi:hypothetical protein